jgi:hypothetical protein
MEEGCMPVEVKPDPTHLLVLRNQACDLCRNGSVGSSLLVQQPLQVVDLDTLGSVVRQQLQEQAQHSSRGVSAECA